MHIHHTQPPAGGILVHTRPAPWLSTGMPAARGPQSKAQEAQECGLAHLVSLNLPAPRPWMPPLPLTPPPTRWPPVSPLLPHSTSLWCFVARTCCPATTAPADAPSSVGAAHSEACSSGCCPRVCPSGAGSLSTNDRTRNSGLRVTSVLSVRTTCMPPPHVALAPQGTMA